MALCWVDDLAGVSERKKHVPVLSLQKEPPKESFQRQEDARGKTKCNPSYTAHFLKRGWLIHALVAFHCSPEHPEELIVCSKDHRAAGSAAVEPPLLKSLPPYPKHLIVFNQNPLALLQCRRRPQVVNEGSMLFGLMVLMVSLTLGLSEELHSVFAHTFRAFWGGQG